YLSNYATIQIKDELARLPGVAEVGLVGQRDYALRVWVNPEKLAARGLTAVDVAKALEQMNVQVAGGTIGKPPVEKDKAFQFTVTTLGRLADAESFGEIILKTTPERRIVRLKDVARTELGAGSRVSETRLNGRSAVLLDIYPMFPARPREVSKAVR